MAMTRDPHGTAGPAPTVGQAVAAVASAAAQAAAVAGAEAVAALAVHLHTVPAGEHPWRQCQQLCSRESREAQTAVTVV